MRAQRIDIQVVQDSLRMAKESGTVPKDAFLATIEEVYSERMTCDIKAISGEPIKDVPIKTEGGLVDGKVYGVLNLPAVGDWVIVTFAGYAVKHKVIDGTILPYLNNSFTGDAVNSGSKQYTKKLLEKDKSTHYRRIFQTGTTVEVEADGSVVVETPSGAFIRIDENAGTVVLSDMNGNVISMESGKVMINGHLEVDQ